MQQKNRGDFGLPCFFVHCIRRGYRQQCVIRRCEESKMNITVEQIAEEALSLPSEARALLADRLVESLDPAEDGYNHQLWIKEARRRIDEVRGGQIATIAGEDAFARVRAAVVR